MPSGRNRGLVQTVLGLVPSSELGPTTTREHLYLDFSFMYRPAQDSPSQELEDAIQAIVVDNPARILAFA